MQTRNHSQPKSKLTSPHNTKRKRELTMDHTLGFVTTDYSDILSVEEREMETMSIEALSVEMLIEELLN
jgi:ribosome-binding protein aMBF1 (putative translation factor)